MIFCTETIYSNDWNHWVFSKILKEQKTCKVLTINKKIKSPKLVEKKTKHEYIKKGINRFLNYFSSQVGICTKHEFFKNRGKYYLI